MERLMDIRYLDEVMSAKCIYHPEIPPACICTECKATFCNSCVRPIGYDPGGICPSCGSLCVSFKEVREKLLIIRDKSIPFGLTDFEFACRFPFQLPVHLAGMALLYGISLFSSGFFFLGEVGLVLGVIGLFPALAGSSVMLGMMKLIIKHLSLGRMDTSHIFDEVSILADIALAFLHGLSVLLSLLWPIVLVLPLGLGSETGTYLVLLWALLYYPLALIVNVKTERFLPTINPFSGLAVVRMLKSNYFRFLLLYVLLLAVTIGLLVFIFHALLYSVGGGFTILLYGTIAGIVIYLSNMILASIIGRVVFKSSLEEG